MQKHTFLRNQEGFTLVEIIAVLIILGILAAVAVPRYIDLEANAKLRAIDAAVSELNGRESLTWADIKISGTGYRPDPQGQDDVWGEMTARYLDLGSDYGWVNPPIPNGQSTLEFKSETFTVSRTQSTRQEPAIWRRVGS